MPKVANTKRGYTVALQADEIIPRGRAIEVQADAAIDPQAWRGVAVAGQRVNVKPSDDGKRATIDTQNLPPGTHTLRVGELWSKRSGAALPGMELDRDTTRHRMPTASRFPSV